MKSGLWPAEWHRGCPNRWGLFLPGTKSRYALALLLAFVTACGSDEAAEGFSVTDSLGIAVAENFGSPEQIPIRVLNDSPEREITGDELFEVRDVHPLGSGQIAVGASGSGAVLIYDGDGELVLRFGRTGDGPGEFRRIENLVGLPGDSLGVYDSRLHRLTVFSHSGEFGRVVSLAELVPPGSSANLLALDDGLVFVGISGLSGEGTEGVYRNTAPSYRLDMEGEVATKYGEFPGLEAFFGIGMMGRAPFGAALAVATSGTRLVVGTAEEPELLVFGLDGELSRIIRWADTDRTINQERMDEYLEFLLAQSTPEEAAFLEDRVSGMPFARRRPAHAEVLAGPNMSLWVEEYLGPEADFPGRRGPSRRWLAFSPEGELRERIETPEGFLPLALVGDHVWGVYRDTLDVESIRAYTVSRQ
jgi:hypothetical protein